MATPHDPEEEPTPGGVPDDEAVWRSIVENYGDRPEIGDAGTDADPPGPVPPAPPDPPTPQVPRGPDPEDHYVPPPPPPMPRPEPHRLLAWLGLFGVPTFVLVSLVAGLDLPSWLGLVLMVWFVGGFVYLVASMRPGNDDDYDDGAVL